MTDRTPRERWGTCCPSDPECDHSYLDDEALFRWMDTPISDEQANGHNHPPSGRDLRAAVAAANQRAEQAEAILAKLDGDDDMLCGELARMLIGVSERYPADLISVTVWDEAGRVVQWLRALVADQPATPHTEEDTERQYPHHGTCDGCAEGDVDLREADPASQAWICEACDQHDEAAVAAGLAAYDATHSVRAAIDAYNAHHFAPEETA